MKETILKIYKQWKSGSSIEEDLLSKSFVYVGPSKMMTTEVWKELSGESGEIDSNILSIVSEGNSGAILFEYKDDMTSLNYRCSWFLKFDESELLLELIETKESVEA